MNIFFYKPKERTVRFSIAINIKCVLFLFQVELLNSAIPDIG